MSKNKFGEPWSTRRSQFNAKAFRDMQSELAELSAEFGELGERFAKIKEGLVVDGSTKYERGLSELKLFTANARLALAKHDASR